MLKLKHVMMGCVVINSLFCVANLVVGNLQWACFNLAIAFFCQVGYLQEANKE